MSFLWTTLMVKDMEASLKFYTEAVGLPVKRRMNSGPMDLCFLGEGNETEVELIQSADVTPEYTKNVSMGFAIDSCEVKIAELKAMGIEVYEGPFSPNPFIEFFYVLDPNGFKIQFVEDKRK